MPAPVNLPPSAPNANLPPTTQEPHYFADPSFTEAPATYSITEDMIKQVINHSEDF